MKARVIVLLITSILSACSDGGDGVTSSGNGELTGTSGSTARMTIDGDYLYAISGRNVQLFDITTPEAPAPWTQVEIDWDIQTLFPYDKYLLVGAADGIHILDNSDPASPQYVGDFQHATAIDPVVARNGIAYVTLKRDSSQPGQGVANQMNIIDINDVTQPILLDTVSMQGPEGLSVNGDRLHVCDGRAGLKTFDLTDPVIPVVIDTVRNANCRDVIAVDSLLHVIDDRGFSQYDTTTGKPLLMSTIESRPVIYVVDR